MQTDPPATPRSQRSSVILRALLTLDDGTTAERRVRNLSDTGACIDHDGELAPGTVLRLTIGAVRDIAAEVVWTRDRFAGIAFAQPIDMDAARRARGVGTVASGWIEERRDAYGRDLQLWNQPRRPGTPRR